MTSVNHLFLDLENVAPPAEHLALIRGAEWRLWVLHGPHQKKFTSDRVRAWQPLGGQVTFVQSAKTGKNALDFHIAFCLGAAIEQDATHNRKACYIVVSRDTDFESLFAHINSLERAVGRAESIPEAMDLTRTLMKSAPKQAPIEVKEKKASAPALSANAVRLIDNLRGHPRTQPTTRKKLEHHVVSLLGNNVEARATATVINELVKCGALEFDGIKPKYNLRRG